MLACSANVGPYLVWGGSGDAPHGAPRRPRRPCRRPRRHRFRPTCKPDTYCVPAPPPFADFRVKIHDDRGFKKILDAKAWWVPTQTYCASQNQGGTVCLVRREDDPQADTCNNLVSGKSDTGRYGPNWFYNDDTPCRAIGEGDNERGLPEPRDQPVSSCTLSGPGSTRPAPRTRSARTSGQRREPFAGHGLRPLAITVGDPAGIGPEVVLRALADPEPSGHRRASSTARRPLLVERARRFGLPVPERTPGFERRRRPRGRRGPARPHVAGGRAGRRRGRAARGQRRPGRPRVRRSSRRP